MSYSSSLAKHFIFAILVTCTTFVKTKKHVFQVVLLQLNTSSVRIHTVFHVYGNCQGYTFLNYRPF